MSRPLRYDRADGWCHTMSRGFEPGSYSGVDDRLDMALWLGRRQCGLTLGELGEKAGGIVSPVVSHGVRRIEARRRKDRKLARSLIGLNINRQGSRPRSALAKTPVDPTPIVFYAHGKFVSNALNSRDDAKEATNELRQPS